ncbi:hypothetical protein [Halobaculum sp. MBLA0143]|uniref:hypothetical protein n=1 Tax=Halobaculum sp. MBLA0143 TaxID=3079933 RepID=UPI0035242115
MASVLYLVAVSALFVPWVYGLYALGRDTKNRLLPAIRQYRRGRRRQKEEAEREEEREERRRQLY